MAMQSEIAEHLFVSTRLIAELVERGVFPKAKRGEWDQDDCRKRYLHHLRMIAAGREKGLIILDQPEATNQPDLNFERARLAAAQADGHELKNAAARRELLPRSDVHRAVTTAFQRLRDKLTRLPLKLAPKLARLSSENDTRLFLAQEIDTALSELSEEKVIACSVGDSHDHG